MPRRKKYEEHDNHEAWAIPYGDLVTLLLAFFVVMYAMSSVNEGKYRVLSDSLAEAFHGQAHSAQPLEDPGPHAQPIEQMPLTQVNRMIMGQLPSRHLMQAPQQTDPAAATTEGDQNGAEAAASLTDASANELGHVAEDVDAAMASLIEAGQVHVHRHDNWVVVDISSDILFGSGQARLSAAAMGVLQRLADSLRTFPNAIRVTGHTDNRPIKTVAFPSNWELSSARAASVVHLFMDRGITAQRLSVMGFGEYRPVMSNNTETGRNANRRVEVMIMGRDANPEP
ncbi:MAG TPA: flagellar motor protein MotD [Steroidobacteraceae bacterium]|jgi:chemotaxis protein MotB|nr:flagellar motor protein MotD [Steroidobacteraceae bacterium]